LISEGVARQSFNTVVRGGYEKNKSRFNNYLAQFFQTIGKAVNEGGGVLYTVNSQRLEDMEDEGKSGESSLLAMARHGGGKYFAGSTSVDIAGEFKRNTAAYYELLFTPEPAMGERLRIGMQSKRRGIEVHTIKYSEMQRPYGKMNRLQKKLFALDVAKKGDWSRMHASILPAKYKVLGRAKKRGMVATNIEVELPEEQTSGYLQSPLATQDAGGTHRYLFGRRPGHGPFDPGGQEAGRCIFRRHRAGGRLRYHQ